MKILVLTNLYPPHHAGTFDERCQAVTDALRLRGHEIRVLTSNHGLQSEQRDTEIERRLFLNGMFGHESVTDYRPLQALEAHNHAALQEAVADFEPDLVHVFSLTGLSKSLMFGLRRTRLPVVYDVADLWIASGIPSDPWLRWWNGPNTNLARKSLEMAGQRSRLDDTAPTRMMKGLDRIPEVYGPPDIVAKVEPDSITAFRFDRLYFCSLGLKSATVQSGFRANHGDVIYPGIAAEHFCAQIKPPSEPVQKFLVVADLEESSGVATAIEALRLARETRRDATLTICGRGDSTYVSKLRSLAVRHALPVEFVTMSNLNRDLAGLYRQHDAFVYPTEWEEPFSPVLLEAMASGLPIIAALSGGVREFIRHCENGFVFTPGSAAELASRMYELQTQPNLRHQMAESAQAEVMSNHNETTMIDRIENYLNASIEYWQQA